jgi:CRISP-associated protein Cas1
LETPKKWQAISGARAASDQIYALLNYGYSILESEIRKAINALGLDPAIGFLHELATSKTPLVYNIQELFRWLIDLSVIQLLEEKHLRKSDFIMTENYHSRLKDTTSKTFIGKIAFNINRKVMNHSGGKSYTYQNILLNNVQRLANFLLDKRKDIQFDVPSAQIMKTDSLEIRERISNITPNKRKRLGINKSTLWYQKRHLSEGKRIRVYSKVLSKIES